MLARLKQAVIAQLDGLGSLSADDLVEKRYHRLRRYGDLKAA